MINYPKVSLDFMNRDHAEFIALRDSLLDLLARKDSDIDVKSALGKLLEHTRHHFAEEARQMQELNFPPYPVHKMEHDRMLEDMKNRIEEWQQHRDAAALENYLESTLIDWFVQHVGMMDFVTARYIAAHQ